jgi:tetratricopeptide (TPR) repeat protein
LPASAVPLFGRSLIATGRTSDAVALIPKVQAAGSKSDAIALAEVFTSAQLPNEALNCLSKVLQQPQVPTRAWYVLGVASEEKHDFASARRAYKRAVAEDARFAEALSALGALALKEGESGKAVDFLQRASAASSAGKEEFAEIQRRLIVAALKARREDVVRTAAAALFALNTKRQEDLYLTGTAFLSVGSFQAAERAFTDYLATKPDDARAEYALGSVHFGLQNYPKAQQHLERSIALDASQTEARYELARVFVAMDNLTAAREQLESVVKAHPDYALALALLGEVDLQDRKYAEAAELLERSEKLDPENAETHYRLSLAYEKLGKLDQSQQQARLFQKLRATQRKTLPRSDIKHDPTP